MNTKNVIESVAWIILLATGLAMGGAISAEAASLPAGDSGELVMVAPPTGYALANASADAAMLVHSKPPYAKAKIRGKSFRSLWNAVKIEDVGKQGKTPIFSFEF